MISAAQYPKYMPSQGGVWTPGRWPRTDLSGPDFTVTLNNRCPLQLRKIAWQIRRHPNWAAKIGWRLASLEVTETPPYLQWKYTGNNLYKNRATAP